MSFRLSSGGIGTGFWMNRAMSWVSPRLISPVAPQPGIPASVPSKIVRSSLARLFFSIFSSVMLGPVAPLRSVP